MATSQKCKCVKELSWICNFYRRFIKSFSTIVAPLTKYLKKKKRKVLLGWRSIKEFWFGKTKLTTAPILTLPDFDLLFEVNTDAHGIGIGIVLKQEGRVIEYFSEKLNDARKKWTIYEQELSSIGSTILCKNSLFCTVIINLYNFLTHKSI